MKKTNQTVSREGVESREVPTDLRKALALGGSHVQTLWKDLTPIAHRDFIRWIESAKQPETRKRRVDRVSSMLASGKRRPCCYAVVPMSLYTALNASPRSKAMWSSLTADERRDLVDWIDAGRDLEKRGVRIAKVCVMLAKGKRGV